MNYKKHYDILIERSRGRTLDGYVEKHHIIPRCLGGSDDDNNIAILTPEEHFLAHQLLVKIYPNSPPLVNAAIIMTTHHTRARANNKLFGWLRRQASVARKKWLTENGHPKGMLGKIHSEEKKKQISVSAKKSMTESVGIKVYAYNLDGTFYREYPTLSECARDLKTNPSNVKYTAEGKFKYCKGKQLRYDYLERVPPYVKPIHPLTGRDRSETHKENLKNSLRNNRKTCIYCRFESTASIITRFHNEKCKDKK